MKNILVVIFALVLASCEMIPTKSGGSTSAAETDDSPLLAGFEELHQRNYRRSEASFNAAIDQLPQFDAGQIQARIGKILIYLSPGSSFHDVDRAKNTLDEINILTKRAEMTNTVYEQTLILSVKQLVESEVENENLRRKVNYASGDTKKLEEEIARLTVEKAQADKTIAKLRSLTLKR